MTGGKEYPWLSSLLTCLLPLSWMIATMAQDVMPSDDLSEFSSSYRYIMNGSELSRRGLDSVSLVPLSTNLLALSPDEFARTMVGGSLVNVNASNAAELPAYTIPYISCDDLDVTTAITNSFNSTEGRNVIAAILYSETRNHCYISSTFANAGWHYLLTVFDVNKARQIALELGDDSLGIVQIFPDLSSLPPRASPSPERRGSPIPMIILYALTSMITVLLLIVIVGGAIKARRHPERYGPRAILRPRQSRAKGIAMAILETLPIVRFGDPEPKQRKSGDGERDVEMTAPVNEGSGVDKESQPIQPPREAETLTTTGVAASSRPASPRVITDEASTSQAANNPSGLNTSAQKAPKSPLSQEGNLPKEATDSLSCSICTEDFTLGEHLRVLPCNHKFHPLCVDPWLLNVSGTCPLCRIDLRPPSQQHQEVTDDGHEHDDGERSITATRPPPVASDTPGVRSRSTIGSIMRRSILSVDLQAIREASQDERLSILRRWREERRRHLQSPSDPESAAVTEAGNDYDPATATATARPRPHASAHAQRRNTRLSQWVRDGFHGRSSESMATTTDEDRPRTWYAGAGAGDSGAGSEPAPNQDQDQNSTGAEGETQRPPPQALSSLTNTEPNARTSNKRRRERASTWYGDPTSSSDATDAVTAGRQGERRLM